MPVGTDLEDANADDFLSAWLECLKLGKPWGGRGFGGRGIQPTTGESRDINVRDISLSRGSATLLENATLKVAYGHRVGIVARNGVGKSTLLQRIALQLLPGFPPHLKTQLLHQQLFSNENFTFDMMHLTPVELVLKHDTLRTQLLEEETRILGLLEADTLDNEKAMEEQVKLQQVYGQMDALELSTSESRALSLLQDLGFTKRNEFLLKKKFSELSGGWKLRVCLAGCLFTKPDVLLLDEPTNHLDSNGILWLENYLKKSSFKGTVLIVTHDRTFLQNTCSELIFIKNKSLSYFNGTYDEYLEIKEQKFNMQSRKSEALDKQKEGLKKVIAESSKSKISKQQKVSSQRKKKLERLDRIGFGVVNGHRYKEQADHSPARYKQYLPQAIDVDEPPVKLSFPAHGDFSAGNLINIENLSYGWKANEDGTMVRFLVKDFSASINQGARIGLCSLNGKGKSTLISLLVSQVEGEDKSERLWSKGKISCSRSIRLCNHSQTCLETLSEDLTPAQLIVNEAKMIKKEGKIQNFEDIQTASSARQYLGRFGVKDKQSTRKIGLLSGGQKVRVSIAKEFLKMPEFLILDEPTNHLDLESVDCLISAIQAFKGTTFVVSHDRHFLANTCNEIWVIENEAKAITSRRIDDEDKEAAVSQIFASLAR